MKIKLEATVTLSVIAKHSALPRLRATRARNAVDHTAHQSGIVINSEIDNSTENTYAAKDRRIA